MDSESFGNVIFVLGQIQIFHCFLVSQKYVSTFLNPRKNFIILGEARGRMQFLRCHNLFHLFISQQSNLALVLPMMLLNELPDDMYSATSLLSFKKRLKAYFFSKCIHLRLILFSNYLHVV